MGGCVFVRSSLGSGSCFCLAIPSSPATAVSNSVESNAIDSIASIASVDVGGAACTPLASEGVREVGRLEHEVLFSTKVGEQVEGCRRGQGGA